MEVFVSDTQTYPVNDESQVRLSMEVGDGQAGGTSLMLDNEILGPNGAINNVLIGTGKDLRFKILRCTTRVHDINVQTNRTSVTHKFSGGKTAKDFPYTVEVSEEGGFAMYSISFIFV